MQKEIIALEKQSRLLDPAIGKRTGWNKTIQQYANRFLDSLDTAKGYVTTEEQGQGIYDLDFLEEPRPLDEC